MVPRSLDAGRGIAWWSEAWALFTPNAGLWIVFGLVLIASLIVLNLVPLIGGLAATLIAPVFGGGWMIAARKAEGGGTLAFGDLFAGFSKPLNPLLVLGALMLIASLILGGLAAMLGLGAVIGVIAGGASGSPGGVIAALGAGMFSLLVLLVLGVLMTMALWFAPALVCFHNVDPVAALKASFSASLKNIGPFLLYGLLYIVAAVVASVLLGLGWLVLIPVLMLTVYTSYKDAFDGG